MALVIEDGTGVEGANSFATVAQARAVASTRGRAFPADTVDGNAAAEKLLIGAYDYLVARGGEFKGTQTTRDQTGPFPREGVIASGFEYDCDEIPDKIVLAQILLAIESQTQALFVNETDQRLVRMKIEGAVELQYADTERLPPKFAQVEALLAPFIGDGADGVAGGFTTERV